MTKGKHHSNATSAGKELNIPDYHLVRSHFVARGTSLRAWCEAHGIHRQFVWQIFKNRRGGPSARRIVEMIKKETGL